LLEKEPRTFEEIVEEIKEKGPDFIKAGRGVIGGVFEELAQKHYISREGDFCSITESGARFADVLAEELRTCVVSPRPLGVTPFWQFQSELELIHSDLSRIQELLSITPSEEVILRVKEVLIRAHEELLLILRGAVGELKSKKKRAEEV